jgi:hypothetical protein
VLGDALDYLGRCRQAEQVLGSARAMATTDRQRTNLAVRRASALAWSLGEVEEPVRVTEEIAAAVTDACCRGELDALHGDNLLLAADIARSVALDEAILAVPGDAAFAKALLDVGAGLALAGRNREAIDRTDAALSVRMNPSDEEQMSDHRDLPGRAVAGPPPCRRPERGSGDRRRRLPGVRREEGRGRPGLVRLGPGPRPVGPGASPFVSQHAPRGCHSLRRAEPPGTP